MTLLKKAIQLETEAGSYYQQQAAKNKGTPIETAFAILAKAETKHEEILQKLLAGSAPEVDESQFSQPENLFDKLGSFKTDEVNRLNQLEVYKAAKTMEQNMVNLYRDMQKETKEPKQQSILSFLIKQEQSHFTFLETLEELLKRPAEWVESAEFGIRKEY
jgi:rubrerythrin